MIGDNQNFSITTDTLQVIDKIRFEGSPENTAFLGFQKVMTSATKKAGRSKKPWKKIRQKQAPKQKRNIPPDSIRSIRKSVIISPDFGKQFPNSALATFANFTLSFLLLIFQKKYLKIPPTGILKYKKKNTSFQSTLLGQY